MSAITLRDIDNAVSHAFSVCGASLQGRSFARPIAWPRMAAYALARERTRLSYPRIGDHYHRDHTTVLVGRRRALQLLEEDSDYAAKYERARALLEDQAQTGLLLRDRMRRAVQQHAAGDLAATWV